MLQYTVTQWVFFFYFYCFFGWCFESAYVSAKTGRLTNRGFMRGPFLPLYGSGAIMMLVVSYPFRESIPLTYFAGCAGATALEYATGVIMEAMFKVRYWDYSGQKFNFQGHICLKSTLAWGGLTILMTQVVHRYVESTVFLIPDQVLTCVTFVLTAWIFADFSLSFKAALDLRDVLIKLENAKIEWGHLQMRMDVLIALKTEDLEQRIAEYKEELRKRREGIANLTLAITSKRDDLGQMLGDLLEDLGTAAEAVGPEHIKERMRERISESQREMQRRKQELLEGMSSQFRKIILGNPSIRSEAYDDNLKELREHLINDTDAHS